MSATTLHKLAPCSSLCVFLGYSAHHKGYHCLDTLSNRFIISHHVTFDESVFPFTEHSNSPTLVAFDFLDDPADLVPVPIGLSPPLLFVGPPAQPLATPTTADATSPAPLATVDRLPLLASHTVAVLLPQPTLAGHPSVAPTPLPQSPMVHTTAVAPASLLAVANPLTTASAKPLSGVSTSARPDAASADASTFTRPNMTSAGVLPPPPPYTDRHTYTDHRSCTARRRTPAQGCGLCQFAQS